MRWLTFNCILMTSLTIILATNDGNPKQKRDLSHIKSFIKSKLFGTEKTTSPVLIQNDKDVKIFRIPGFNNVLVKAVPKVPGVETAPPEKVEIQDPSVAIVGSYLGTKTQNETLNALQGVKNLLQSGILNARTEVLQKVVPVVSDPARILYVSNIGKTQQDTASQVSVETTKICADVNEVRKPGYLVPTFIQRPIIYQVPKPAPVPVPVVPVVPQPIRPIMPIPTVLETITPVEIPSKYSYKQVHNDGSMATYTSRDGHHVFYSNHLSPLPPFVTYRLHEVFKLGVQAGMSVPLIPVTPPRSMQFIPFPNLEIRPTKPNNIIGVKNNFSYKQIHNDGMITEYSDSGTNLNTIRGTRPTYITNRIENVAASTASRIPHPFIAGQTIVPSHFYNLTPGKNTAFNVQKEDKVKLNASVSQNVYQNIVPSSRFSYHTIHRDGTMTKHTGSGLEQNTILTPSVNRYPVVDVREGSTKGEVNTTANQNMGKIDTSPKFFQMLHKNGSMTTFSAMNVGDKKLYSGPVLPPKSWYPTVPRYPYTVRQEVNSNSQNFNRGMYGAFSYQTVHNDGSITAFGAGEKLMAMMRPGNNPPSPSLAAFHSNRVSNIAKVNGDSFSYRVVHSDGSVTSYATPDVIDNIGQRVTVTKIYNEDSSKNVIHKPVESSDDDRTAYIAGNQKGTFSYQTIHNGGSISLPFVSEEKSKPLNEKFGNIQATPVSSILITDKIDNNISRVNAGSFSYRILHKDGMVTSYGNSKVLGEKNGEGATKINLNIENKPSQMNVASPFKMNLKTNPGLYSYKIVHADGSTPTRSTSGQTEINKNMNLNSQPINNKKFDFNTNNNLYTSAQNSNAFSYKTVHSDGSVTTYSNHGEEENKNGETTRKSAGPSTFNIQVPNSMINNPNVPTPLLLNNGNLPSRSFSFKTIHGDSKAVNYIGGGLAHQPFPVPTQAKPITTVNTDYQQQVQAITPDMPNKASGFSFKIANNALPINSNLGHTYKLPIVTTPRPVSNMNTNSFSYKAVHKDGTVTTHIKNGNVENTSFNQIAPLNVQSSNGNGQSTISVNRNSNYNVQKASPSSPTNNLNSGSFLYKTINGGTVSSPMGVVSADSKKVEMPNSSGFSYKLVHNTLPINSNIEQATQDVPSVTTQSNYNANAMSFDKPVPNSFLYKAIHKDGTVTTHTKNGNVENTSFREIAPLNVQTNNGNDQSTMSVNRNSNYNVQKASLSSPTNSVNSGSFSYKTINGGTVRSPMGVVSTDSKKVEMANSSSFSNKLVRNKLPIESNLGYSTQQVPIATTQSNYNTNAVSFDKSVPNSFSYKAVHKDGTVTTHSKNGNVINTGLTEMAPLNVQSNINVDQSTMSFNGNSNYKQEKVSLPPPTNNFKSGSFSYKTINGETVSSEMAAVSTDSKKVETSDKVISLPNIGNGQEDSVTTPKPHTNAGFSFKLVNNGNLQQTMGSSPVTPVSIAAVAPDAVPFSKPIVSSYSYKQISHSSPNNFTVVKVEEPVPEKIEITKNGKFGASMNEQSSSNMETIPNDYVYIPPSNVNEPLPSQEASKPAIPNDFVYFPPTSATAPIPINSYVTKKEGAPLAQNQESLVESSLKTNPIVVADAPTSYSYQQSTSDGSSVHVNGSQNGVSVNITPQRDGVSRGDIPE